MKKNIVLISLLFFAFSGMAQQKVPATVTQPAGTADGTKKAVVPNQPKAPVDLSKSVLDPAVVETSIKAVVERLKNEKENKPLLSCEFNSYSMLFESYSKLPRVEKDTRIYSVWYKSVADNLNKLAKFRENMELAKLNNETSKIEELKVNYKDFVQKMIYLLEHPQKVGGKGG